MGIKRIFTIAILSIFAFLPMSCNESQANKNLIKAMIPNDMFYYNSYIEYDIKDGIRGDNVIKIESGTIKIYGNVIVINRTTGPINYFITDTFYDEENQIYNYTTENACIEFDVCDKRLVVDEDKSGTIYFINSEINTSW